MQALFAHGAFNAGAAAISAAALTAYGVGLPAFVLVRIVAATFYARGDTLSPVRATIVAVIVNIALKIVLVWGAHLGAVGIALGTALGAWANVAMLIWMARSRGLMTVSPVFRRALGPTVLAAAATGAAAYFAVRSAERLALHPGLIHDACVLGAAVAAGVLAYLAVVLLFRRLLPLRRLTG